MVLSAPPFYIWEVIMTKLLTFKLLVLGAIDLLPLGSRREHKQAGLELDRHSRSREEYFVSGVFVIAPELETFLTTADLGTYDAIIIVHHNGWGHKIVEYLPRNVLNKTLVVDRLEAPKSYPSGILTGEYGDCWDWIKGLVRVKRALTQPSGPPGATDAPYCFKCVIQMQRAGSCFACPNCAATSGCD